MAPPPRADPAPEGAESGCAGRGVTAICAAVVAADAISARAGIVQENEAASWVSSDTGIFSSWTPVVVPPVCSEQYRPSCSHQRILPSSLLKVPVMPGRMTTGRPEKRTLGL